MSIKNNRNINENINLKPNWNFLRKCSRNVTYLAKAIFDRFHRRRVRRAQCVRAMATRAKFRRHFECDEIVHRRARVEMQRLRLPKSAARQRTRRGACQTPISCSRESAEHRVWFQRACPAVLLVSCHFARPQNVDSLFRLVRYQSLTATVVVMVRASPIDRTNRCQSVKQSTFSAVPLRFQAVSMILLFFCVEKGKTFEYTQSRIKPPRCYQSKITCSFQERRQRSKPFFSMVVWIEADHVSRQHGTKLNSRLNIFERVKSIG